jgi:hypothetical protein
MSETARQLRRRVRSISRRGGRGSRVGLMLMALGALLLVVAIIGAIAVNV